MEAFFAGTDVTLRVDPTKMGVFDAVTGATYQVFAQDGTELLPSTVVDSANITAESVAIPIAAQCNALATGKVREIRMVTAALTTSAGTFSFDLEYVIEAATVLVAGENSFASYGDAVMIGYDIPALEGWNNVDKNTRVSALLYARRMIGRLSFKCTGVDGVIQDLNVVDPAQWVAFSDAFKEALARAQVIEANEVCGGDPIIDYRRRGIQSITVGESKNFLQGWKAADERTMATRGISPATALELKPYLASTLPRLYRG